MTDAHQCSKVDFLFLSLCFQNDVLFVLHLVQWPSFSRFELLPFLVHCCLRIQNSHRLELRNKVVHQIVVIIE